MTDLKKSQMPQNQERLDQFAAEIAAMKLPNATGSRDRMLLRLGEAMMVLGIVIGIIAYPISHMTTDPLQQRDAIVIAIIGMIVAMVGCAVFVRYSITQFLRFWMARLTFERDAASERRADRN